jgi:hypothetical protein
VLRLERDTTAPRIELDAGGEIVCTDSRFDLTGHASEPVVLRVAGVETSVSEAFRLPVPLRVGRNDLVVRARDRAGNESVARLRVHRPDPAAARAGWKASALRQRRYDEETLTRLETLLAREAWQLPRWPWNRRGMLVVDHAPVRPALRRRPGGLASGRRHRAVPRRGDGVHSRRLVPSVGERPTERGSESSGRRRLVAQVPGVVREARAPPAQPGGVGVRRPSRRAGHVLLRKRPGVAGPLRVVRGDRRADAARGGHARAQRLGSLRRPRQRLGVVHGLRNGGPDRRRRSPVPGLDVRLPVLAKRPLPGGSHGIPAGGHAAAPLRLRLNPGFPFPPHARCPKWKGR